MITGVKNKKVLSSLRSVAILPKAKVAVGLSGGVDSAVAAAILKKQGYEVVGVHLYCYDEGPYCTAKEDRVSAVRVAKHLEIPLLIWDLRREYKDKVIKYFFAEYKVGRTPNPDVVCNREIKFGLFMEKALRELKVGYVATGHYARVVDSSNRPGRLNAETRFQSTVNSGKKSVNRELRTKDAKRRYLLLRGIDELKDQSYFLYTLTQEQLEHILFPIGAYKKLKVRQLAQEFGLPNYSRKESMGVCFIGPVPIAKFLREHLPAKIGSVMNTKGEIIGEHDGVWFFTEGQRHGFSARGGQGLPLYVVGKDVPSNTLIVGWGEEAKVKEFEIEKPHFINSKFEIRNSKFSCGVRIRHLGEIMSVTLESVDSKPLAMTRSKIASPASRDSRKLLATLAEPAFGVAPGQSAVFYGSAGPLATSSGPSGSPRAQSSGRKEEVLGGGVISKTLTSDHH